jgi:hypothetical protein
VTVVQTKDGKLEYLAEYDPSKGDAYYAISNPKNVDLALVLADFTYFGASIKTGERVCYPIPSKALQDRLKLREPSLPIIAGKLCNGFSETFSQWTERNFGISQAYAFRHLYNALGQQYGLNQETRALNMGHTVAANEGHYKQRNKRNNKVRKALLTVKNPLPYETAILELEHIGIDLNHSEVKLILRTIYQLD